MALLSAVIGDSIYFLVSHLRHPVFTLSHLRLAAAATKKAEQDEYPPVIAGSLFLRTGKSLKHPGSS
jgi:hypothetical protein